MFVTFSFERKITKSLRFVENFYCVIKKINSQPLYRYTKFKEEGKVLILIVINKKEVNIKDFLAKHHKLSQVVLKEQIKILFEEYNWIESNDKIVKITLLGEKDTKTFLDLVYARWS